MKVVFTILGTYNAGGMERVLTNKVNYFVKKGYDITIITTDQKGRSPYFRMDEAVKKIDLGVNYKDIQEYGVLRKTIAFIKKQLEHRKLLTAELIKLRADIVVSLFDNDAAFLYKIKDGSKKVIEIHFSRFKRMQYNRSGIVRWIDWIRSYQDQYFVRKYDRFVVLTEEDKSYWNNCNNIEVIPNACTFTSSWKASLENKKVLAIGRLDSQKGFDDLIRAWVKVKKYDSDWTLNIYGSGPLKFELLKLIQQLNLEKVVFIHPPTQHVNQVYREHAMLAISSRYEGLPMVMLEAQANGLPIVSYACKCGPREIISHGINGFLVDEGNVSELANKIILLINNFELRQKMGDASYQNSFKYTQQAIMPKWISLFERLKS